MSIKDKLAKKHDPASFQWQDSKGQVFKLTELSQADLLQVACSCMDVIEKIDQAATAQAALISAWRDDSLAA